jgi:hypothetical protein
MNPLWVRVKSQPHPHSHRRHRHNAPRLIKVNAILYSFILVFDMTPSIYILITLLQYMTPVVLTLMQIHESY